MKSSGLEFVTIGQIIAPWGNKGELKVEVVTDFPHRFSPPSMVYVNQQPVTIISTRWHKGKAIIRLDTTVSAEDAQRLRGQPIEIHHSQLEPLLEGQYYHFQVIGLEVWTTQGEFLGNVTDIISAKSNDNYVVSGADGEIIIPTIEDVIKSIDLDKGRITIEAIEGLLSLNKKATKQTIDSSTCK